MDWKHQLIKRQPKTVSRNGWNNAIKRMVMVHRKTCKPNIYFSIYFRFSSNLFLYLPNMQLDEVNSHFLLPISWFFHEACAKTIILHPIHSVYINNEIQIGAWDSIDTNRTNQNTTEWKLHENIDNILLAFAKVEKESHFMFFFLPISLLEMVSILKNTNG